MRHGWRAVAAVSLLSVTLGCSSDETLYIGVHESDGALEPEASADGTTAGGGGGAEAPQCQTPSAPPVELSADGFYTQYLESDGVPILASEAVAPQALVEACSIVSQMLALRSDVAAEMVANGVRVAIMSEDQQLRDLPGFEALGSEWDGERGAGATLDRPFTGAAEENLLCLPSDVYRGEVILVHSFAHSMRALGIGPLEDDFDSRLSDLYEAALAEGKWQDTYAATSFAQYWAEGVQTWFSVNQEHDPPDGIHNAINTHEELRAYDPDLFDLLSEYFAEDLTVSCF